MRTLKGDVDILGLGTLLQGLATQGREGVLTLVRRSNRKTIHIGPRGMRLYSTSMQRVNKVGNILLRRRKISPADLDALLEEQRLLRWKFGHLAVDSGKITRKDLEDALLEQVQEEIYDMFLWTGATFEFVEGAAPRKSDTPLSEVGFSPDIARVILDAARHADEIENLRKLIEDEDVVLTPTGKEVREEDLGDDLEDVRAILPLVDGRRSVREVDGDSIYPRFATLRAIQALLAHGYAVRRTPSSGTGP